MSAGIGQDHLVIRSSVARSVCHQCCCHDHHEDDYRGDAPHGRLCGSRDERYRRSPHGAVGPAARRRTTVVVLLDQDSPRLGSRAGASGQEEMTAKGGSPGPQEPALSWADSAPFRVLGLLPPQQREAQENAQRRAVAAWIEASPAEPKYPLGYTFGPQLDPTILRLVRAASTRPHLAEQQLYPLARNYPKAVVMAGNTALTELLAIRPAPPADVLNALEEAVGDCDCGISRTTARH
jgi:hypothetical protein